MGNTVAHKHCHRTARLWVWIPTLPCVASSASLTLQRNTLRVWVCWDEMAGGSSTTAGPSVAEREKLFLIPHLTFCWHCKHSWNGIKSCLSSNTRCSQVCQAESLLRVVLRNKYCTSCWITLVPREMNGFEWDLNPTSDGFKAVLKPCTKTVHKDFNLKTVTKRSELLVRSCRRSEMGLNYTTRCFVVDFVVFLAWTNFLSVSTNSQKKKSGFTKTLQPSAHKRSFVHSYI